MRAVCINTIHSTWKNIVFTGFFIASTLSSIAAERVALVIGNGAYEHTPRLVNPVRDADAVEKLLGKAGFEIVLIKDADAEAVYAGLEKFKIASRGAGCCIGYHIVRYGRHTATCKNGDTGLLPGQSARFTKLAGEPKFSKRWAK